jgi:peptidoglycan/xylan/chitin deacetylase (PgdA/CDA1 family)
VLADEKTWEVVSQISRAIKWVGAPAAQSCSERIARLDMRRILKSTAQHLFHCAGGLHLVRRKNRHAARILMYHRFSDPASLEMQCIYLKQHYELLSMRELSEHLQFGRPFPPNTVVITVDDGYRDFLKVAFPVFSTYGIPVTVFLVTDFIDKKVWLWPDVVKYAFENTAYTKTEIQVANGRRLSLPLDSLVSRLQAARLAIEEAKTFTNRDRLLFVDNLKEQLQVETPQETPEHYQPLHWDEVRSLVRSRVEFGAHTRTHSILSKMSDDRELWDEIVGSKKRIEEELSLPVFHFCYPNGRAADISDAAVAVVRDANFRTAVTRDCGLNLKSSNRLLLRRIGVEPDLPELYFRQCVAGFRV